MGRGAILCILFDFPTVPQLDLSLSKQMDKQEYASSLITAASLDSQFIARDTHTGKPVAWKGL